MLTVQAKAPSPLVLQRHTLTLPRADTVALKRLFCGDGTSQIGKKRKASTDEQWNLVGRNRRMIRHLAVALTAITTLNFGALARLIAAILAGHAGSGRTLLLDAINIWVTNVVIFALWFWALDRGGPATRGLVSERKNDFLF